MTKPADSQPENPQPVEQWFRYESGVIDFPVKMELIDGVLCYRQIYPDKGAKDDG